MNLGKYKLITQQAWGLLAVPVAMMNLLAVLFALFSLKWALLALAFVGVLFLGLAYMVNRVTLGQEYNYAWEKTPAFTEFRAEVLERLGRIEENAHRELPKNSS